MTVSRVPAVSEAPAVATPAAGEATLAVLPSAVQDLVRLFLSLSGSSSLEAAGGVAGVAASAAEVGDQLCPSASAGGAVALGAATAITGGASGPPSAPAAVPGMSGHQQHQEVSRPSRRRRRRSSSDGTDRRSKKRRRGRSPSPGSSSRRQERHYQSSSSSSVDERAAASSPRAGREPGGTPGVFRPAPAGDRSPRPGTSSWTSPSSVRAERYRSGTGHRSPSPSGVADEDRSSAFDTVDFSGLSWPSSGTSTPWKSLQESHRLGSRLLLHRSLC